MTPFDLAITVGGETVIIDGDRTELAELPRPLTPRKLDLEQSFVARHSQPAALARNSGFGEVVIASATGSASKVWRWWRPITPVSGCTGTVFAPSGSSRTLSIRSRSAGARPRRWRLRQPVEQALVRIPGEQ